jgi:hypothetical protein
MQKNFSKGSQAQQLVDVVAKIGKQMLRTALYMIHMYINCRQFTIMRISLTILVHGPEAQDLAARLYIDSCPILKPIFPQITNRFCPNSANNGLPSFRQPPNTATYSKATVFVFFNLINSLIFKKRRKKRQPFFC